jgi:hypothetical protein
MEELPETMKMFEWADIGFGDTETVMGWVYLVILDSYDELEGDWLGFGDMVGLRWYHPCAADDMIPHGYDTMGCLQDNHIWGR